MDKICEELYRIGIVPVIAIDDAKDAEPLAEECSDIGKSQVTGFAAFLLSPADFCVTIR